jgi:ferric-dicitrate binding protein FerR (iron transport regulator)
VEVIEGRVTFSSLQKKGAPITVGEGFCSSCAASSLPTKAKELAYSGYPEWMNNRFEYHNADMKSILAEIEAHFSIKIVVKDPGILEEKYSGVIEGACPEVVLQTLVVQIDRNMRFNENIYEIY